MSLLRLARRYTTSVTAQTDAANSFITIPHGHNQATRSPSIERHDGPLQGRTIAVKDNICHSIGATTCGSALLKDFRSPYVATVVQKLEDSGAFIDGTTNLDEFGMGSDSINSVFGPVKNVYTQDGDELSAGGSSGGSAIAVASGRSWAALGTDTGGSVRLPASYTGVVGFKPSYGMISRWGMIAYANSMDTVGILAETVSDAYKLFHTVSNYDSKDPTSLNDHSRARIAEVKHQNEMTRALRGGQLRVGIPAEYNTSELDPAIRATWLATAQTLHDSGHKIVPISLASTRAALSAYYILAPSEASSNLAKYDGVRYGQREARSEAQNGILFAATRGKYLGQEVQRRILLGAYSLSATARDNYFVQAQRIRRLVQEDFDKVFALPHPLLDNASGSRAEHEDVVDVILTPTSQSMPPKLTDMSKLDPTDAYSADILTVPASLAGLPAISVPRPICKSHRPHNTTLTTIGLQLIGQFGADTDLLDAAAQLENL